MERTLLMMDDDFQRVFELKAVLSPEINILHAYGLRDASKLVAQHPLSVAVLKLSAVDSADCFEFLADLRAARPMPIIMIHTMNEEERTLAYDMGADLCIDAPANTKELAAGIRAQLRRYYTLNRMAQLREAGMVVRYKELAVDPQHRTVTMRGRPVELLAKEFDVLYFLVRHPGSVFTKDQIYEHVWKEEHPYGSQSVADHICAIRRKLGLSAHDKEYIETVRHIGYRFVHQMSNPV